MVNIINSLLGFIFVIVWLMGIILAKGFWLTSLAIFCPCYGWYLVIEKAMIMSGFI